MQPLTAASHNRHLRGSMANSMPADGEVTQMLADLSAGKPEALDGLMPIVYDKLRAIAHNQLRRERSGHTLTTTALVNEAYLKLVNINRVQWQDRAHFFAVCARAMRRILVNYAEMKKANKRGGGQPHVEFHDVMALAKTRSDELLALDEALDRLEKLNERRCRVVEYRFFGGMSIEETARTLEISPATVKREWAMARAWLNRELGVP